MRIGKQIGMIRKEQRLTQEAFGDLFHVTRQTVSNWENEKSYPDLQTLVSISDRFQISLDVLLKEDAEMVKTMDKERAYGAFAKKEKAVIDFFTGAGTGLIASCVISPDSSSRTAVICVGVVMLAIGWYKREKWDKAMIARLTEAQDQGP